MWQQRDMEDGGEEWDAHEVALDTVSFSYPMRISLVLIMERKPKHLMLAEQMIFERFPAFLYMDLHKGMAAVNLLRCCRPCGRGSLAIGGYDICCCERGAGHRRQDLQADGRRQTGEGEAKDGDGCRGAARKKRYERVELTGGQSPDAEGRIRHPADHAGRVCTETECAVRAGKHRRSVPFWDRPLQLIREHLLGILKKRRPQSPTDSAILRLRAESDRTAGNL